MNKDMVASLISFMNCAADAWEMQKICLEIGGHTHSPHGA